MPLAVGSLVALEVVTEMTPTFWSAPGGVRPSGCLFKEILSS